MYKQQVRKALFGPPNSTINLQLRRKDGTTYNIIAMRHLAITKAGKEEAARDKQQVILLSPLPSDVPW